MSRPLLVIDGDSFAHRAFHGLPKTIRRRGDKGGGAIVGFANFLLRLYLSEAPRRDRRLGHARRSDLPA
jgi:DNA polymerase-1